MAQLLNAEEEEEDREKSEDSHSDGTRPWSSSSVRNAESLVQVKVRHVRPVITWPTNAHLKNTKGTLR